MVDKAKLPEKMKIWDRFRFITGTVIFCLMVYVYTILGKEFPQWWVIFPSILIGVKTQDLAEIVGSIMRGRKQ